jgi:hypothetical protein
MTMNEIKRVLRETKYFVLLVPRAFRTGTDPFQQSSMRRCLVSQRRKQQQLLNTHKHIRTSLSIEVHRLLFVREIR